MLFTERPSLSPAWRLGLWDHTPGTARVQEDRGFVTFSATKNETSVWKARHDGEFFIRRKLAIVAMLVTVIVVGASLSMLLFSLIQPGLHQVEVKQIFEPTAMDCFDVGYSYTSIVTDACRNYFAATSPTKLVWQPYWWGAPLFFGSIAGVIGALTMWATVTAVNPLVRQLKVLLKDWKLMRLPADPDVREVQEKGRSRIIFEGSLGKQVRLYNQHPEEGMHEDEIAILSNIHGMSAEAFTAKAAWLFVEPIDPNEVVGMFRRSIEGSLQGQIAKECDEKYSQFLITAAPVLDQIKRTRGTTQASHNDEASALADAFTEPLAALIVDSINESRYNEAATGAASRYLNNLSE